MTTGKALTGHILAYAAIAVYITLAVTVLPGFAPALPYDRNPDNSGAMVMAKADRLPFAGGDCAAQDWPNISSNCLHNVSSRQAATNVRLVTVR